MNVIISDSAIGEELRAAAAAPVEEAAVNRIEPSRVCQQDD